MKKFAIITGANSGIGEAVAEKMKNDYNLLLIDKDDFEKQKNSENIILAKCDVRNYKLFEEAIQIGIKKFGEPEIIINNAGTMILDQGNDENVEDINEQIDTNLKGVIFGTRLVLNSMLKRKTGTIINISSLAGIRSFKNHPTYCGTKFAVRGYTFSIRDEVAKDNVRVSIVSPGIVLTNLLSKTKNEKIRNEYMKDRDKNKTYIQAQDVANAIWFIISQPQSVTIRELVITPTYQET